MTELAKKTLVEHKLKVTQNRLDVLSLFMSDTKAYSLLHLENIFGKKHNRSSIFRCLQILNNCKILEKFVDSSGVAVYVLNTKTTSNSHSHFKCNQCENVQQLPELPLEYLNLLGKNKIEATNLYIEGTCEKCQES
jgi:Fur family transcriptional regulator, ferric uptake regulator